MKKILLRSPHPSARSLKLPSLSKRVIVRHGASRRSLPAPDGIIEINPLENVRRNADKLAMKEILMERGIRTPECFPNTEESRRLFKQNGWNVVFKRRHHRRSIGMYFLRLEDIDQLRGEEFNGGVIERRINVKREWRIHCCPRLDEFFAMEKRKRHEYIDSPNRNLETCVFRREFVEPDNWHDALSLTRDAITAMGLDVACSDLAWSGKHFYIIEVNSGSGLGPETTLWYQDCYTRLAQIKIEEAQ